ncbi:Peroxisome biosynthesis protein pex1 [Xylographa soralifera]|nr:Peroxisome biosynthesis protein pex1 [Xylographa soralifera]
MAPKRSITAAEVGLVQLRNCLVNLPASLVTALVNANTVVQNVIIELQYRANVSSTKSPNVPNAQQSVFVGWTGMASQRKAPASVIRAQARNTSSRDQDIGVVEVDATFGRMLGLAEGQKVGILVHLDPPLAHTVNIEPLTPGDWEIIELHATFLEVNLVAQIRALPNPSFTGTPSTQVQQAHPLTLHLSPTSTANIIVTSLTPPLSSSVPFAKLDPDAEVIVAEKSRPRPSIGHRVESRSNASISQRSAGAKSSSGTTRRHHHRHDETNPRRFAFLRGVSRAISEDWFDEEEAAAADVGLKVWVDQGVLQRKKFTDGEWICVSIVDPAGLHIPMDPQQQQKLRDQENSDVGKYATKVVAKLLTWEAAPDDQHVILSSSLCATLGADNMAGGIVKLEVPSSPVKSSTVSSLKLYPFTQSSSRQIEGLKFGGSSKASRDAASQKIWTMFGDKDGILSGPLTDGLIIPKSNNSGSIQSWNGGILRFSPPETALEEEKSRLRWLLGDDEAHAKIDIQHETTNPIDLQRVAGTNAESLPVTIPALVGIDNVLSKVTSHVLHHSSVLLAGGLGSGKTSSALAAGHTLRRRHFCHVSYFPCRKVISDETRVSTIKETFNRIFMAASWAARMGGRSLVILDDLDKLCPVETELEVGGENGKSRQLSELIRSIVRQYHGPESGVTLLATAQSKDALNSIIIGGHVVREIVNLKAPTKDIRRQILESLTTPSQGFHLMAKIPNGHSSSIDNQGWMDGSLPSSRPASAGEDRGFVLSCGLDFLEIAGIIDGYMPGDLVLLLSRARNEALIRSTRNISNSKISSSIHLAKEHFDEALKGFKPASLRNVTLQSSSTTFASIGGLHATRKILLETLQYPTTYAPIFAQCPLRLRSGLLLYGYPGCGKTLLASAVAGECGLNFISVKGPEILNKYIGASEKSVRDLFERAEAARPCVLFFDEFDSIAPKRGHDSTGVTDRVVNQLLTQMDGAEGLSGVYVLAATSRPDLIDPALLRPGRLDKSLICDLPNMEDRLDILHALSTKLKIDQNVLDGNGSRKDLAEIAHRTDGYSGADLQAVVYNAHLEAIHDVLGDHKGSMPTTNGMKEKSRRSPSVSATTRELIQFRFGEDEERLEAAERASSGINRSKEIAERAALIAKLDAVKLAKRKERALRHGEDPAFRQNDSEDAGKNPEVVIRWSHIEASLATTRSSISTEERRKLGSIYREFQVGRNGEMPSGQGGMEIGGRSSLM